MTFPRWRPHPSTHPPTHPPLPLSGSGRLRPPPSPSDLPKMAATPSHLPAHFRPFSASTCAGGGAGPARPVRMRAARLRARHPPPLFPRLHFVRGRWERWEQIHFRVGPRGGGGGGKKKGSSLGGRSRKGRSPEWRRWRKKSAPGAAAAARSGRGRGSRLGSRLE